MLAWNQAGQCPKPGHYGQKHLGYCCLEVLGHQLGEV